ncbi:MAG: glycoside hydrolase family 3 C-terminal domain-containing protein, partial [Clostridia bacterium]|nr:glycoside hydrolase family 3 C-terminal domain-containing protein [Clostridia bacterium]
MNKHRAFCRKAAAEGMILLKNDNNILPLDKNKQIAVFGRSQYLTAKSGEGSGNVCGVEVVSLADGLKNAGANLCKELFDFGYNWHIENGFKGISYAHEIYKNDASIPEIPYCDKMIENAACKAETAVVIFTRRSGENVDIVPKKGDYYLSDDEVNLLKRVKQAFKNTVLLLNYGERYDLSDILDINPDSILYVSQGGQEIGNAIADVIFGDVTPSGKLTGTWAKSYKDHPSSEGFGEETAIYKEGIYVGYRYFDTFNIEPVYPFGYGLSYTEFSFDDCHAFLEGDKCTVALSVTNVGEHKGKEVVEVYVSKPDGKIENAYQDLAAFDKTKLLLPGETERLAVTFSILDLTGYCSERESYVLQSGEYYVRVGNSSRNTH